MQRRMVIPVVVLALAAAGSVRADMVSLSAQNPQDVEMSGLCGSPDPEFLTSPGLPVCSDIADLEALPFEVLDDAQTGVGHQAETQSVCILSDKQNSLGLCLYALFGLGLCKSTPWVKRLSLGIIPGWYHDGGPFQIGHSSAIVPDCLDPAPAYCLVQPDGGEQTSVSYRHQAITISLWRASQFSPTGDTPRGPPERAVCGMD